MTRSSLIAVTLLAISSRLASGAILDYVITGTVTSSDSYGTAPNPITVGESFAINFSYDTAAPPEFSPGSSQAYHTTSPAQWTIGGESLVAMGMTGGYGTLTVTTQLLQFIPTWAGQHSDGLEGLINFNLPSLLSSPVSISQIPVLTLADLSKPIGLDGAVPVYLNGSLTGFNDAGLTATSLTLIPEPSTVVLLGIGAAALVAVGLHRSRRAWYGRAAWGGWMVRLFALAAILLPLFPDYAMAAILDYVITGTVTRSDSEGSELNPITVGEPFAVNFTYDTAASPGFPPGDSQFYGSTSPAQWTIGGESLTAMGMTGGYASILVEPNLLELAFSWAGHHNDSLQANVYFDLSPSLAVPVSLAEVPQLTLADLTEPVGFVPTGGEPVYLNGSITGFNGADLTATSLTLIPEPSTVVLAAFGLVALAVWCWRQRALSELRKSQIAFKGGALMRRSFAVLLLAVCAAFAPDAPAVTIDWAPVGNPGNANDAIGYGSVAYNYSIDKYDVTVGQYASFLNSVAATDTYGLYDPSMASDLKIAGISQSGSSGSYSYSVIGSSANLPITYVTWGDAARFSNWLQNGQPTGAEGPGTTETGAYTLNGATTNAALYAVTRNADATVFIPSENEWYKAAYYNPANSTYYQFPFSSNVVPTSAMPGSTPNTGNFQSLINGGAYAVTGSTNLSNSQNYLTPVGAYTASASPYGVYDMGGDVWQWNEALIAGSHHNVRGGSWSFGWGFLSSEFAYESGPTMGDDAVIGFRVASIPEPSTVVLAAVGLAGLVAWSWRRRSYTA